MSTSHIAGQRNVMPLHGSKYFYHRFDLSGGGEVNLLPAVVTTALPFGVHRVRITVIEDDGTAALKVNGVPDNVASGKILKNAVITAKTSWLSEPHEIAMHITQLSAIQTGQNACTLEVEYWSGQA